MSQIFDLGSKRLRKQAKFLSNFVLYTMQKKLGFSDRINQIQTMSKLLEEWKERKAQVSESINNMALYKANQLSEIEKVDIKLLTCYLTDFRVDNNEIKFYYFSQRRTYNIYSQMRKKSIRRGWNLKY